MVAAETRMPWWCSKCQAIVRGPASSPSFVSELRNATIWSITSPEILEGDDVGFLELGSNAASPSAR